ncbi:NAD(P)/FAD-dependent oxidoreductase [Amaricoccus solimangrovi]|uniref:FAD-dependent oxidoreductase n=1 Tax=Amaricoccus solimangrovi TaxID=2589815 RepID=A0A501WYN5_9RHOB|nr:FAD-dependent monooxygenase [Amaricoccus solimangrovi]TPE52677.1 FAD-dependent oxidoreductase [Amaricoccus solimangrovi]
MRTDHYDAIIVGARVAGAATGLLLARAGARVLILDREAEIGDTLSTHALMRPAVELLGEWGLLGRLLGAGTPVVRQALVRYGAGEITVPVRGDAAVPGLCAPRRRLLDRTLLEAAAAAGAEVALGAAVEACLVGPAGRITGVSAVSRDGRSRAIRADLVIGADGRGSRIAELADARTLRATPSRAVTTYGYFAGIENRGYRWYFGPRVMVGVIPTNDDLHCVCASCPPEDYRARFGAGARAGLAAIAGALDPELSDPTRAAPAERLRRFAGAPGHMRARAGRGWALVGDAACFKDPMTALGISDALLDARHLAGTLGRAGSLASYARERNARVAELFEATERIASFDWDYETLASLHARVNACLRRPRDAAGLVPAPGTTLRVVVWAPRGARGEPFDNQTLTMNAGE